MSQDSECSGPIARVHRAQRPCTAFRRRCALSRRADVRLFRRSGQDDAAMSPLDMPAPPPRVVEVSEPEVATDRAAAGGAGPHMHRRPRRAADRGRRPARRSRRSRAAVGAARSRTKKPPASPRRCRRRRRSRKWKSSGGFGPLLAPGDSDLNRINYQALNADARTQYDTARRFISQAEDARAREESACLPAIWPTRPPRSAAQLAGASGS